MHSLLHHTPPNEIPRDTKTNTNNPNYNKKQGAKGISLFLVDAGTAGFTKGTKLKKMGMKAQDTCELFFEDCRIPKSALLGEVNKVR